MNKTLKYKGYQITVEQDVHASNPFKEFNCEPPTITYYGGRHGDMSVYCGAPETLGEIVSLMPDSCFERGKRVKLIKDYIGCSLKEFAEIHQDYGDVKDSFRQMLTERYDLKPKGWGSALEWFEVAASLLTEAGIPCLNDQSIGYSQRNITLVLVIATQEWRDKVGCDDEHVASNLQGTVDLYSAWAWGDVYGISEITDPDGAELDEGSVWGFYGDDHEKSGLLESARNTIDWHLSHLAEIAVNEPACLI
jgi:hypothetical protein